jgi:hypothetical protein
MWMLYCFMLWWKEDVEESNNGYKKGRKFCARYKCSTDLCYDAGKKQNNKEISTPMEGPQIILTFGTTRVVGR